MQYFLLINAERWLLSRAVVVGKNHKNCVTVPIHLEKRCVSNWQA